MPDWGDDGAIGDAAASRVPRLSRHASPLDLREAARAAERRQRGQSDAVARRGVRPPKSAARSRRSRGRRRTESSVRRPPRLRAMRARPTRLPRIDATERRERERPTAPRNAPTIPSIFTSPSPIASTRRRRLQVQPRRRASPAPTAAPRNACSGVRSREKNERTSPMTMPGRVIDVGQELEVGVDEASARQADARSAPETKSAADGARRKNDGPQHAVGELDRAGSAAEIGRGSAAAPAEHDPREDRHVVARRDRRAARRAARARAGRRIRSRGSRWIRTFRKLPTSRPKTPATTRPKTPSDANGGTPRERSRAPPGASGSQPPDAEAQERERPRSPRRRRPTIGR